MRHIDEVLRLAAQGLSQHEISASLGISRTSVHNYLERARQAGLSWPLPKDLDAAGLEARLFKRTDEGVRTDRPEPNWLEVHHEHKRGKHVTLQLLHLEYKAIYPDGWGYTQFCAHYRRWLARQDVVMRLEYAAGERMFVDFAGDTVPVTDPQTGEVWDAQIFVSVLGASGYLYAEAVRSQDVASWLGAHVRALEFYSGSVRLVVPDNLKSGVTKSCWYEPGLNASYQELARWYSLGILPARPYRPKDKGAVEAGVQVAEHWILAPLRKRRFFSLGELNVAIAEQVRLVNEPVEVRATAAVVEIFHRSRRVASHVREYGRKRFITDPEHMPAAHRAHLEWTPSKLIAWGRSVGPAVAELVETILNTRPHPEHGYRACMGLKRLVKRYGPERLTAACQRALATHAISYGSVQAILKNNLDRVPVAAAPPAKVVPIRHANLRGAAYYQQTLALLEA